MQTEGLGSLPGSPPGSQGNRTVTGKHQIPGRLKAIGTLRWEFVTINLISRSLLLHSAGRSKARLRIDKQDWSTRRRFDYGSNTGTFSGEHSGSQWPAYKGNTSSAKLPRWTISPTRITAVATCLGRFLLSEVPQFSAGLNGRLSAILAEAGWGGGRKG